AVAHAQPTGRPGLGGAGRALLQGPGRHPPGRPRRLHVRDPGREVRRADPGRGGRQPHAQEQLRPRRQGRRHEDGR
ncbi:unnamed protein product, partial [Heterosigma akashiwo]